MGDINLAQACVDRTSVLAGEDDAIFTSHWRVDLPFAPDVAPMDHPSRVDATNKLTTFWTALAARISSNHKLREVRWYDVPNAAPHKPVFIESIAVANIPGSSTLTMPLQVSCSVTFRTAVRKNWGRFYIPGWNAALNTNGRMGSSTVDSVVAAAKPLTARGGGTAKATLTVWSPTEGTHHDPQWVECDDIMDIIRRRRPSTPLYKKVDTAG